MCAQVKRQASERAWSASVLVLEVHGQLQCPSFDDRQAGAVVRKRVDRQEGSRGDGTNSGTCMVVVR